MAGDEIEKEAREREARREREVRRERGSIDYTSEKNEHNRSPKCIFF